MFLLLISIVRYWLRMFFQYRRWRTRRHRVILRHHSRPPQAVTHSASWLRASAHSVGGCLCKGIFRTLHVTDTKLGDCSQLSGHPRCQHFAALLFSQTRTGEVSLRDKCYNVDDHLVLIENSIDNDRDERCQVGLSRYFNHDNHQAAGLEHSTEFLS